MILDIEDPSIIMACWQKGDKATIQLLGLGDVINTYDSSRTSRLNYLLCTH